MPLGAQEQVTYRISGRRIFPDESVSVNLLSCPCRFLALMTLLGVLPSCATQRISYRAASNQPLAVRISPEIKTPDNLPVAGLTAAWGSAAGFAAGPLVGLIGNEVARKSTTALPAPKQELSSELLAAVTPAIRADPRFKLVSGPGEAEFRFQVQSALFSVDSAFSSALKPLVAVEGLLMTSEGRILWKYFTEFRQTLKVPEYEAERIRSDPALRLQALQIGVRRACEDMVKHLRRQ